MAKEPFVIDMRHDSTAEPTFAVREDYEDAVEVAHKFFEGYGFELRDGKPFDEGNADDADGGFKVFDNVKMHKGKVAGFMHADGEGPCCTITRAKKWGP